ncbi:hypothetical protein DO021_08850 [Desulfobacter hydrogenophilus]|uniref:Uncharacterized protein n=1 Tax=Desulfobacter hydrogenophilus TaxID=2291 RepID=A0A328FDM8_9BACT|nr:hypothetical protein [Desulfobacter hydrogenophilus]QBH15564.1 hypothetical protein EYB58_09850 [Desulfobacter hydrogenophilus]RAM02419.1 hypothetical protein DO021_08850 [Desulfobacter hydrogenophilus]
MCEFCRVRSCISQKGFPRYYLPCSPKVPQDAQLIYLPYWRFKGVRYMCTASSITPRFTDISTLAVADMPPQVPFSLGLRSQAMPMKLIRPDTKGKFFRPLPSAMVLKGKTLGLKQTTRTFQEDIGETFSLIYSPFYIRQQHLVDGVTNQALPIKKSITPDIFDLDRVRPGVETYFIAGICPGCGADLEGSGDSLVLVCRNCDSLWRAREKKLAKIKFSTAAPAHKDDIMLPFWRISANISSINLSSHADLARMANLPLAIPREWEKKPVYFWSPAFKVRPNIFLRLLGQLTSAQLEPPLSQTVEDNLYQPVNLPASEAIQTIRITMASLLKPRKEILEILSRIEVTPQNVSLIFLPFKSSLHDIIHPDLGIGINKKALALSDNL